MEKIDIVASWRTGIGMFSNRGLKVHLAAQASKYGSAQIVNTGAKENSLKLQVKNRMPSLQPHKTRSQLLLRLMTR
jgi:hypothetical protein